MKRHVLLLGTVAAILNEINKEPTLTYFFIIVFVIIIIIFHIFVMVITVLIEVSF